MPADTPQMESIIDDPRRRAVGYCPQPDHVLQLRLPGSVALDPQTNANYRAFFQATVNRRVVGGLRYGDRPKTSQRYMSRMGKELAAYRKTGNVEHLFNIANYAFLESVTPEHKHQHLNPGAESVTRADMGGEIA
jgi:hypothetical protein